MTQDAREILLTVAGQIVEAVRSRCGSETLRCAFVGGSVARNEVASVVLDSRLEVFSDVDLYLVVDNSQDLPGYRERAREAAAGVKHDTSYKLWAAADVGVFSWADLVRQPVRPGSVDLASSHVVIAGQDMPWHELRHTPQQIPREESLYLMENRILETRALSAKGPETDAYRLYLVAKHYIDAVSAALVFDGRYASSRAATRSAYRDLQHAVSPVTSLSREAVEDAFDTVQHPNPTSPAGRRLLERNLESDLCTMWIRLARDLFGAAEEYNVPSLVEHRAMHGARLSNLRELMRVARSYMGLNPRFFLQAWWLSAYSSRALLRMSGLLETLVEQQSDGQISDIVRRLDSLTSAFGYETGDVFSRAREMHRAVN